jgi:hypothetical protein
MKQTKIFDEVWFKIRNSSEILQLLFAEAKGT